MNEPFLDLNVLEKSDISLLDTLDHVLGRGLVISGDVTISVADVDLIYLGLNVLLGSIETIKKVLDSRESPAEGQDHGSGEVGSIQSKAGQ